MLFYRNPNNQVEIGVGPSAGGTGPVRGHKSKGISLCSLTNSSTFVKVSHRVHTDYFFSTLLQTIVRRATFYISLHARTLPKIMSHSGKSSLSLLPCPLGYFDFNRESSWIPVVVYFVIFIEFLFEPSSLMPIYTSYVLLFPLAVSMIEILSA